MNVKRGLVRNVKAVLLLSFLAFVFLFFPGKDAGAQETPQVCCVVQDQCFGFARVAGDDDQVVDAETFQDACLNEYFGEFHDVSCEDVQVDGEFICRDIPIDPPADTVVVKGYVLNNHNEPYRNSATVTFGPSGGSGNTNNEGFYSVALTPDQGYAVTISSITQDCSKTISNFQLGSADLEHNFTLNCERYCVERWDHVWEDSERNCGYRTSTLSQTTEDLISQGICPESVRDRVPSSYVECPVEGVFSCTPDGHLDEATEECDPENGGIFPSGQSSCTDLGYDGGTLICSNTCRIVEDRCFNCSTTASQCTSDMCGLCDVCDDAFVCRDFECSVESCVVDFNVDPTHDSLGINLSWDPSGSCIDQVVGYSLRRCDAGSGNTCATRPSIDSSTIVYEELPSLSPDQTSYFDNSVEPEKKYCYELTTKVSILGELRNRTTDWTCATAYNEECVGRDSGSYCSGDDIIFCGEDGLITSRPHCGANQKCIETSEGVAVCYDPKVCDLCSGPFGFFGVNPGGYSLLDFSIQVYHEPGQNYSLNVSQCGNDDFRRLCYMDEESRKMSSIGHYKACEEITSCYDYRTRNSCENNPCDALMAESCDWLPFEVGGEEFGFGVCQPANPELFECQRCEDMSPTGVCDEDMCNWFGGDPDRCFYNADTSRDYIVNKYSCMNREHVACETYNTMEQCIGMTPADSNFDFEMLDSGFPNFYGFQANIAYDSSGNRIGNDHAITALSQDVFGRGVCVWDLNQNACFRDADMSRKHETTLSSDCDWRDLECLTDTDYPNTLVSLENNGKYSATQVATMYYSVSDEVYSGTNIKTFFSVSEFGGAYPDKKLSALTDTLQGLSPGGYVLRYFSKDKAKNHEPVQNLHFTLIPRIEDLIDVSYTESFGYSAERHMLLTNITVRVDYDRNDVHDLDRDILCNASLVGLPDGNRLSYAVHLPKINGNPLTFRFNQLEDNDYTLTVSCVDAYNQFYENVTVISVENDNTIHSVSPRGETFREGRNITLSLNTSNASDGCYYAQRRLNSVEQIDWIGPMQRSSDGRHHTTVITRSHEDVYFLNTSCDFNGERFYGNAGDMIYFAVDNTPPELTIREIEITGGRQVPYNEDAVRENVTLRFTCNDDNDHLVFGNMDLNFGCDENAIRYCRSYGDETCTPTQVITVGEDVSFGYPDTYRDVGYLNLLIQDKGGNSRTMKIRMDLRPLGFDAPEIIISPTRDTSPNQ